jgi:hypothetical protein
MMEETKIRLEGEGHIQRHHGLETNADARLRELEIENQRLQLLVAELLLKNQHLRKLAANPVNVQ